MTNPLELTCDNCNRHIGWAARIAYGYEEMYCSKECLKIGEGK